MNYPLCFSTIHSILDWVCADDSLPQDQIINELHGLKNAIDIKVSVAKKRKAALADKKPPGKK